MELFLDTCIIDYMIEKKHMLNKAFELDSKRANIIFSVYSVYEIVNQKGLVAYKRTLQYLKSNFPSFKIQTNDLFNLSDKDFIGSGVSFNEFFKELSKPIIIELKRNISNRLLVIWFFLYHIYSILKRRVQDDSIIKKLLYIVRSKLQIEIDNSFNNLITASRFTESNIKKVYKKLRDAIRYNLMLSYICVDLNDELSTLANIDFSVVCPAQKGENLLKLRIKDMKQQVPALSTITDEQIQNDAINVIKRYIDFGQIDALEEKIIEFDLRDIFLNDDVFKANNYVDLYIMRMYLDYFKKYTNMTGETNCYLITADKDFIKRMSFLFNELSIHALDNSVLKSRSYTNS